MEMLGRIVQKLVELPAEKLGMLYDLLEKLTGPSRQQWWRELGRFLRRENPFATTDIRSEWQEFYRKYFRISVDFSDVQIPNDPGGFARVIFIPKGLKLKDVVKVMRKYFPVWSYSDDLDLDITKNIRQPFRHYAIRVRERVEADEELKELSDIQLHQQGLNTIILLEHLVWVLKYRLETGQHLDVENWTLCAGSHTRLGDVVYVYWCAVNGKLRIDWCSIIQSGFGMRARQVVSYKLTSFSGGGKVGV